MRIKLGGGRKKEEKKLMMETLPLIAKVNTVKCYM
jgi:hypothetical protein